VGTSLGLCNNVYILFNLAPWLLWVPNRVDLQLNLVSFIGQHNLWRHGWPDVVQWRPMYSTMRKKKTFCLLCFYGHPT